jgi:hypothetical protein
MRNENNECLKSINNHLLTFIEESMKSVEDGSILRLKKLLIKMELVKRCDDGVYRPDWKLLKERKDISDL